MGIFSNKQIGVYLVIVGCLMVAITVTFLKNYAYEHLIQFIGGFLTIVGIILIPTYSPKKRIEEMVFERCDDPI
jgi:hypothetical protein